MESKIAFLLVLALMLAGIGYSGHLEVEDAEIESAQYAEMVCLGRQTGQQYGWPNYLNLEIDCQEINQDEF